MIIAVDERRVGDINSKDKINWQKPWSDLGDDIRVWDIADFKSFLAYSPAFNGVIIILLHESAVRSIKNLPDQIRLLKCDFVNMFVSAGNNEARTSSDGLFHYTGIRFPATGLQHLHSPFRCLVNRLKHIRETSAPDDIVAKRHDAWARWEAEARPKGRVVLPALAILCQGYLAAHAEDEAHNAGLREALRQMGWDRVPLERKANLAKRRSETEQASWWAQPFNNTDWRVAINTEGNGATLNEVNALVAQFQHSGVTLEVVLAAYRELISVLGGTPWELQRS